MTEAILEETDRISELPEDLLVTILSLVPTKDAVATMFLSKRWLSIWTMVPTLEYKDNEDEEESKKSVWWFLDNSLLHHKAPVIDRLCVKLGSRCPNDVNVGKWVANAVDRRVLVLHINLLWSADPTSLPTRLYSCKSLVALNLSNKILVDFPSSSSCLTSLEKLKLYFVVYKDEDSIRRFLSSCPVLKYLFVRRKKDDNVKKFTVKVPSLWCLMYSNLIYNDVGDPGRCLVIDTPVLEHLRILDLAGDYCSIDNVPCLKHAFFWAEAYPDDRLLRSFSSVLSLALCLNDETLVCWKAINFSRLVKLIIYPGESDWSEPLMLLLGNAPKLRNLIVDYEYDDQYRYQSEDPPLSWNQPNSVPICLLSQLEIFEWKAYGDREEEEQFLTYILANSKCLKSATISLRHSFDLEEQDLIIEELRDIPRISTPSQLLFNLKKNH